MQRYSANWVRSPQASRGLLMRGAGGAAAAGRAPAMASRVSAVRALRFVDELLSVEGCRGAAPTGRAERFTPVGIVSDVAASVPAVEMAGAACSLRDVAKGPAVLAASAVPVRAAPPVVAAPMLDVVADVASPALAPPGRGSAMEGNGAADAAFGAGAGTGLSANRGAGVAGRA